MTSAALRVSVVIPTRNRCGLLPGLLSALAEQSVDSHAFEVILVDNASTDGTSELLAVESGARTNLTSVREPTVGISAARNAGCAIARADWIAFIDDDCLPPPGWIAAVLRCLDENPGIGAMVGRYEPPPAFVGPRWLHPAVISFDRGDAPRYVAKLQGGNMAVRRSALEDAGGFRTDLGLQGERRGWGEETALSRVLLEQGWRILYWPDCVVQHLVKPEKAHAFPLLAGAFRRGVQDRAIEGRRVPARVALWKMLRALMGRRHDTNPHWQARVFLRLYGATRWAGTTCDAARANLRTRRSSTSSGDGRPEGPSSSPGLP